MEELNRLFGLLAELQAAAQPRPDLITPGSTGRLENARPVTFAGRVSTGGETPRQILARVPSESPDAEGFAGLALPKMLAGAGMAKQFKPARAFSNEELLQMSGEFSKPVTSATRTVGRKTFSDSPTRFVPAEAGVQPITPSHQLWPAVRNTRTGDIANAMKPGAYQHESLYASFKRTDPTERGFVDPVSGLYFSERQLAQLESDFLKRVQKEY